MLLRRPLVAALAILLMFAAFGSSVAEAHIPPVRTHPEAGAVLEEPPESVDVWFPEKAPLDSSRPADLRVAHNPSGRRVDVERESALDPADPAHMSAELDADLPPGRYVVSWRATGSDGHPSVGSYSFTIVAPARENDDQVTVMLSVFGAALFAASVGGVGYLLRRRLRLVEGAPEQSHPGHH